MMEISSSMINMTSIVSFIPKNYEIMDFSTIAIVVV